MKDFKGVGVRFKDPFLCSLLGFTLCRISLASVLTQQCFQSFVPCTFAPCCDETEVGAAGLFLSALPSPGLFLGPRVVLQLGWKFL